MAGRACLVLVLAVAVISKLRNRQQFLGFAESLTGILIPQLRRLIMPLAVTLTAAEIGTAALLLVPQTVLAGTGAAVALFAVLSISVVVIVRFGWQVPCRCFGADGGLISLRHVVRNLLLFVVATVSMLTYLAGSEIAWPVHSGVGTLAVVAGAILGGIATRWDDLTFLLVMPAGGSVRSGNEQ